MPSTLQLAGNAPGLGVLNIFLQTFRGALFYYKSPILLESQFGNIYGAEIPLGSLK